MSNAKESDISTLILKYLMEQNRPYSSNDLFNNFQKECGKSSFLKGLDALVIKEKVKEKSYGKQKIYFVNQQLFSDLKEENIQTVDATINNLSSLLRDLHEQIKNKENALLSLGTSITNESAKHELHSVKKSIPELREKLKTSEQRSVNIDPKQKNDLCAAKEKLSKEYRKRKRIANSVIDAIMEGYPKDKKQLLEELGVEVDGDSKFVV